MLSLWLFAWYQNKNIRFILFLLRFIYQNESACLVRWINPSIWVVWISLFFVVGAERGSGLQSILSLYILSIACNEYVFLFSGENGKNLRFIGMKSFTSISLFGIDKVSLQWAICINISNISSLPNTVFFSISSKNRSYSSFIVILPSTVTGSGLPAVVFSTKV